MFENLKPSIKCRSVYDLDLAELKSIGIKGLMFDIDNTLEPYAQEVPSERLCSWLSSLCEKGFRISIVSNAKNARVERFCAGFPKESFPLEVISPIPSANFLPVLRPLRSYRKREYRR